MLPTAPAGPTATQVPDPSVVVLLDVLLDVLSVALFVIVLFVIDRPPPRGPDARG
jgi:hypothetical protein